jgi:hypothetical protein
MRAVACRPMKDACVNGVLFEVPETELEKFDDRETHYIRNQLDLSQIAYLPGYEELEEGSSVWVYLYDHIGEGGAGVDSAPIVQSYLDVILLGCQEIAPTFAAEFLLHTRCWERWHDDRLAPVYQRAQVHEQAAELDQLLTEQVPEAFSQRCLAP